MTKSNFHLNCAIAKSELFAACSPSLPEIPTPTSAFWIMATSLAPSPMASEMDPVFSCTSSTISAFWMGLTRQQITLWQLEKKFTTLQTYLHFTYGLKTV